MKRIALLVGLLACSVVHAETLFRSATLIDKSNITAATTTGTVMQLQNTQKRWAARLVWNNDAGTNPTLDVKVQHCPTATTTTCDDLFSFTQKEGSSGKETVHIDPNTVALFPYLRVIGSIGGTDTPTYDFSVVVYYHN